jgi:prepilin signal peptidase PulO-like enzyme (type II secretory pathway)
MEYWLRFTIFTSVSMLIAIIDFKTHKIPNNLLIVLIFDLLLLDLIFNPGSIPLNLISGAGAYILFYSVFRFREGLGFGDVKYAAIIGYFLGIHNVILGLLIAVITGIVFWCAGRLLFNWAKDRRFAFGPWLGCGAIAAGFFPYL